VLSVPFTLKFLITDKVQIHLFVRLFLFEARSIYATNYALTLEQHVELTKRFSKVYTEVGSNDPEIVALRDQLSKYHTEISSLHLKDNLFAKDLKKVALLRLILKKALRLSFFLIISLPGLLLHVPLYILGRFGNRLKDIEEISQFKFMTLFFCTPIWYAFLLILVWKLGGTKWFLVLALLLPMFGWLHLLSLQKGVVEARQVGSLFRLMKILLLGSSTKIQELVELRKEIAQKIHILAKKYFPREEEHILKRAMKSKGDIDISETENFI
jgi:hypothetical protein